MRFWDEIVKLTKSKLVGSGGLLFIFFLPVLGQTNTAVLKKDVLPSFENSPAKITVHYDGLSRKFISRSTYVGEAVFESGIPFRSGDAAIPFFDTPVSEGMELEIKRAKPVTIHDSGKITNAKSGYDSYQDILKHLKIDILPEDQIGEELFRNGFSADSNIGRLIKIKRAPRIRLTVGGKEEIYASWAGTVAQFLEEKNVILEGKDYSSPGLDAQLQKGMSIRVFRVREFENTEHKVTPYKTLTSYETKVSDSSNCQTRVAQEGQDGITDTRYLIRTEDEVEVWKKKLQVAVTQQLIHKKIVKDRIISSSSETGDANWGNYSGYNVAYNGWGSNLSQVYGKKLLVTNLNNGRQLTATIVDWGPQDSTGDIIDLSKSAFQALGGSIWQGEIKNIKVQKILCEA